MPNSEAGYIKKDLPSKIGKIGGILLAVGGILGVISFITDPSRAAFSYLVCFMFLVSIGIGSLFVVALEYAAGAVWSTPFRRVSEFLAGIIPLLLVLAIPLLFNMHSLFHWTHEDVIATDASLRGKVPYLNIPFFIIRLIIICALWTLFYILLTRNSRKQDYSKDQFITKKNSIISVIFMPVFAFSITIMSVDWMMSLEPHWASTIFGVYYFAGTAWAAFAALTYIVIKLKENGYLHTKLNDDHYYSLGTWMFAFTAFWGYIAFSQYMLIWYGDLPEETSWFLHRWEGIWKVISVVLVLAHFIVPFFTLLSLRAKTEASRLKFIAIWILATHFLDIYWMVMPGMNIGTGGYYFSWTDLVFPIATVGIIILVFSYLAKRHNLIPIGDPKLERGFDFRL